MAVLDRNQVDALLARASGGTGTTARGGFAAIDTVGEASAASGSDFSTGLSHGVKSLEASLLGLVGLAGNAVGIDSVRDWGFSGYQDLTQEMQQESQASYTYEGVQDLGDAVDFAQYWLGYGLSNLVTGFGVGAIGSAVGKRIARGVIEKGVETYLAKKASEGAVTEVTEAAIRQAFMNRLQGQIASAGAKGFAVGSGAFGVGTEVGATYGQAGEEALAQGGTLENVDLTKAVGYGAAAGALEAAADIATLGLARVGPGKALFDILKNSNRTTRAVTKGLTAAAVGGGTEGLQGGLEEMGAGKSFTDANFSDPTSILAGAIGGGPVGVVGGMMRNETTTPAERTAPQDELEQQLMQERRDRAVAEQQAAMEQQDAAAKQKAQEAETIRRRREYGPLFTPKDEFAKAVDGQILQALETPGSEVDSAYSKWQDAQANWSDTEQTRKTFLKEYKKTTGFDLNTEYRNALDAFAVDQETNTPTPTPEVVNELVVKEPPVAAPKSRVGSLRAYAAEKLGPTWEEENPGLSQLIGERKFQAFQKEVDNISETVKAVEASAKETSKTVEVPDAGVESFTPPQRAVYDALLSEIKNTGGVDALKKKGRSTKRADVIGASSSTVSLTRLARAAGLKSASAARDALNGVQQKVSKQLNMDVTDVAKVLSQMARTQRSVSDTETLGGVPDKQPQVLDKREMYNKDGTVAMGTVSTPGGSQSAVGPINEADTTFSMAQPNPVLAQRQGDAQAQYEAQRTQFYDAVLSDPIASEALRMWDQWKSEGAVAAADLSKPDAAEWVADYIEFANLTEGVDEAYMDATQRAVEQRYETTGGVSQEEIDANENAQQGPAGEGQTVVDENVGEPAPVTAGGVNTENAGAVEQTPVDPKSEWENNPITKGVAWQNTAAEDEAANGLGEQQQKLFSRLLAQLERGDISEAEFSDRLGILADSVRQDGTSFFRTETEVPAEERMAVSDIQATVDRLTAKFKHKPKVQIIDTPQDVGVTGNAAGFVRGGTIYLVRSGLENQTELTETFWHELLHYGIRRFMTEQEYIKTMRSLAQQDAWVRSQTRTWVRSHPDAIQLRSEGKSGDYIFARGVDEALAALAETGGEFKQNTVLAKTIRTVSRWIAQLADFLGFKDAAAKWRGVTNDDARALISTIFSKIESDAAPVAGVEGSGVTADPAFSRKSFSPVEYAEQLAGAKGKQFAVDVDQVVKSGINGTKFLHQLIREAKDKIPSAATWYENVQRADMYRNDLRKDVEAVAIAARKLSEAQRAEASDLIGKATFYQLWPYEMKKGTEVIAPHEALAAKFNAMTQEQQDVVRGVFDHGERMKKLIADLAKKLGVDPSFFGLASLDGPYAPLKRFGDWVTVLKSAKVRAAEKMYEELKSVDAKTSTGVSSQTKKALEELENLRQDFNEYVVSHFDTKGQAVLFADANKKDFAFVDSFHKDVKPDAERPPNYKTLEKVLGVLKADSSELPPGAKQAFMKMVNDLYYQSLDETNARLSGVRRLNRAGYDKDMIRSFLEHSHAESALLANMALGGEINSAFIDASNETKNEGGYQEHKDLFDQISYHYQEMLNGKATPIQDRLTAVTTVWLLTSSLGYHITNATQPLMTTVPKIAGDFGNYSQTWKRLAAGYKMAREVVAISGVKGLKPQVEIDITKAPSEYHSLLERLQLLKLLDVGVEEDLSGFSRFRTGYKTVDNASEVMSTITHRLYQVARAVEAYNRVSSAVAAYDLARTNADATRKMGLTAEEYAINIVQDTQGNFSRTDAPLLLKKLPKVTGQYRKYQFMMAWLYSNAFKQAFFSEAPDVRAAGRMVLGYKLAHAAFMGGAMGLPITNAAALMFAMTGGDDEEPKDLERSMRLWLGDNVLADAIMTGVPSFLGLDTNAKMGEQYVFSIVPFTDFTMEGRDDLARIGWGVVSGATGSVAGSMVDAYALMEKGQTYKAVERFLPKGLSNILEAYRLGTEGYSMSNGDVIVDPEEFSGWLLSSALGMPATEVKKVKWTRSQQYEIEQYYKDKSAQLRREYHQAVKDRDESTLKALRARWVSLQNSKDNVRFFFSGSTKALKKQPLSALLKSEKGRSAQQEKFRSYMKQFDEK